MAANDNKQNKGFSFNLGQSAAARWAYAIIGVAFAAVMGATGLNNLEEKNTEDLGQMLKGLTTYTDGSYKVEFNSHQQAIIRTLDSNGKTDERLVYDAKTKRFGHIEDGLSAGNVMKTVSNMGNYGYDIPTKEIGFTAHEEGGDTFTLKGKTVDAGDLVSSACAEFNRTKDATVTAAEEEIERLGEAGIIDGVVFTDKHRWQLEHAVEDGECICADFAPDAE